MLLGLLLGVGLVALLLGASLLCEEGGGDGGLAGRVASGGIEVCLSSQRERWHGG